MPCWSIQFRLSIYPCLWSHTSNFCSNAHLILTATIFLWTQKNKQKTVIVCNISGSQPQLFIRAPVRATQDQTLAKQDVWQKCYKYVHAWNNTIFNAHMKYPLSEDNCKRFEANNRIITDCIFFPVQGRRKTAPQEASIRCKNSFCCTYFDNIQLTQNCIIEVLRLLLTPLQSRKKSIGTTQVIIY